MRPSPRRSLAVSLTVCSALLAGCGSAGGGPRLEHADGAELIALTRRVAAEQGCAQARDIRRLQVLAIALVNSRRVPDELQEPLLSGIGALVELRPQCP